MNRRVLVLNEKHGNRYFYIGDETTLYDVAFRIVKQRLEEGHWYTDMSDEDSPMILTLKDVKEAVNTRDGRAAWEILLRRSRGEHEYERVEIADFEEVGATVL